MVEDQLQSPFEAARAHLQAELDAELRSLELRQAEALAEARVQAAAELEQRLTAAFEAEIQRRIAQERERADAAVQAEAARAAEKIEELRTQLESIGRQREEQEIAARAVERHEHLATIDRLLAGVRSLDNAGTLTDTLNSLLDAAAAEVPRAALLIVNGDRLQVWKAAGFHADLPPMSLLPPVDEGMLLQAVRSGEIVSSSAAAAPSFASLPPDRIGVAVPIGLGGRSVAVLYADNTTSGDVEAPACWPEAIQILARQAAACLTGVTALRTIQATVFRSRPAPAVPAENNSAQRYARLLVSEIKLYNEAAVRLGREKRDLLARLGPEIERARRLYEEHVPPSVPSRSAYFQTELVQTLAGGDPQLLDGTA